MSKIDASGHGPAPNFILACFKTRNRPVSAAMTKSELGVASEKTPTTFLVDWDSARRRARRLAVQSDVGELCFISRSVRS